MPNLSEKAGHIAQSQIRIMSVECEKVRGINLAQGICDTEVPLPVCRAAHEAIDRGANQYTRLDGIAPLRHAIARKLRDFNRIDYDPESEIIVTAGSSGAFLSTCLALLNPGDEVVIFEPFYGYHLHMAEALGIKANIVSMSPPDWDFSRTGLERAITPRTRAIIINTPANPSGKVFSEDELLFVGELARKHDLFLITDEIYEYFVYDGARHISPASLPELRERTITISGFSKTYSITGWRLGYAACDARWAKAIGYFSDLAYICAPSPFQHAVLAGLEELNQDFYAQLNAEYAQKRTLLCETLEEVGLTPHWPHGSYYVLADAAQLPGTNSKERAMHLLHSCGVAAVPGESFFRSAGKDLLRFCFAKKISELEEACRRMKAHVLAAKA
jgi:aminotransferase